MSTSLTEIGKTLKSAYDEQYSDRMTEWREIGGKFKAKNILDVCKAQDLSKVLECGAGEGSILKHLDASKAFSDLYAIEISDTGLQQIQKRRLGTLREAKKFNGYDIPYPDNKFDMVYCSHVIEHVEHPRVLLRELKRVANFQVFEIPLDYAIKVDEKVKHFLSYGHINIYTPSLFKFLLKSEGYEIIDEVLTHTDNEVIRYNWYKNMNLKRTLARELLLELSPLSKFLRRIVMGKERFAEYGYSSYTCLAKGVGELKIF